MSSRRGCEFPAARGRIGLRKRAVSSAKASWGDDDHSLETSVASSAWKEGSRHSLGVRGQGVGKVGSGSWLGDELDGAFGASGQGSGG